jgi:hypothetical protein
MENSSIMLEPGHADARRPRDRCARRRRPAAVLVPPTAYAQEHQIMLRGVPLDLPA